MSSTNLIQSGTLELYALGLCSKEETLRVEEALRTDEQVRKEYDEVCDALNKLAQERHIDPPASIKAQLLEKIEMPEPENGNTDASEEANSSAEKPHPKTPAPKKKVVHKPTRSRQDPVSRWQWLAAASVVLFLGSLALSWNYYKRMISAEEEAALLRNNNMLLIDENGTVKSTNELLRQQYAFLEKRNLKATTLPGTASYPELQALVFWDKEKGGIYLITNSLTPLGTDEQYQLWALENGVPKDAGVIPHDFRMGGVYQLNNISNAQAFAITIEKRGGSVSPTLEKIVVFGKI